MVRLFLTGVVLLMTIPIFQKVIAHFTIDPVQFGIPMTLASIIGLHHGRLFGAPYCMSDPDLFKKAAFRIETSGK